ncbi:tetratricopeptide repeat protein [Geomonas subterranea]|uniref:Tetratricopeptide repeat protein n=1 Tax=Geomonas subterranea TaxID=2847989 RepID=A0ABX8LGA8_9BACT|nr:MULTISPECIES: tetratricopeptide repeat protein [Geomonas]QXE90371.1 tetratricopeptide repeat protein [Geomonas subterranea]QXM07501.1 tetratricopeptide repeat protein [Geomonas subterranea]
MATQKTAWDYLGDMFDTLTSQDSMKAQAATNAMANGAGYFQKKDYARAASEFKRAISLDPTNAQSYNYLANAYLAQKKYDEAIKTYKTSLTIDPTQDSVHTNLGNIYLQQKKYNLAEKEFKDAARINPSDMVAPYTLGQLYLQTNRLPEAEAQFKKVSKMAPTDPNPYYSLGVTYNKEGKFQDAVKQLTQAIKLRPKMAAAHFELGVAYAALGDTTSAQSEVDTLSRLDAAQGELLKRTIAKPKMVAGGGGELDTFFPILQKPQDLPEVGYDPYQLMLLDVTNLSTPNSSKAFSLTFYFDSKMDPQSVQDVTNWTITKASGGAAGYYNNLQPVLPTEAYIPQNPMTVSYDSDAQSATVTFMLSQNDTNNATIDSAHMVFKFSGKDITGKMIDPTADEWDYAASTTF